MIDPDNRGILLRQGHAQRHCDGGGCSSFGSILVYIDKCFVQHIVEEEFPRSGDGGKIGACKSILNAEFEKHRFE